jgi:hypothetical protein
MVLPALQIINKSELQNLVELSLYDNCYQWGVEVIGVGLAKLQGLSSHLPLYLTTVIQQHSEWPDWGWVIDNMPVLPKPRCPGAV